MPSAKCQVPEALSLVTPVSRSAYPPSGYKGLQYPEHPPAEVRHPIAMVLELEGPDEKSL
jgi:hypothetical protein